MQELKIEVRVRDEKRRDEACAKWSTVKRVSREGEGGYEVLWGEKKPDGKQNKGKTQGKEEDEKQRM